MAGDMRRRRGQDSVPAHARRPRPRGKAPPHQADVGGAAYFGRARYRASSLESVAPAPPPPDPVRPPGTGLLRFRDRYLRRARGKRPDLELHESADRPLRRPPDLRRRRADRLRRPEAGDLARARRHLRLPPHRAGTGGLQGPHRLLGLPGCGGGAHRRGAGLLRIHVRLRRLLYLSSLPAPRPARGRLSVVAGEPAGRGRLPQLLHPSRHRRRWPSSSSGASSGWRRTWRRR